VPVAVLQVRQIVSGYGKKQVLHGVDVHVDEGEIVAMIGHNGAGKTTLLRSIFGLVRVFSGEVLFEGRSITNRKPAANVRDGISFVPGHSVFGDLTVLENLRMGAYSVDWGTASAGAADERLEAVYDLFPILKERRSQLAGTLSGGQQQMLAIGMALMLRPRLLLLDEPSLGLAPALVQRVIDGVVEINRRLGTPVLLVEQNVKQALRFSARCYVLKLGRVELEERSEVLLGQDNLWRLF
jgi:branched-chain amino acid transport system ATP-binding protein